MLFNSFAYLLAFLPCIVILATLSRRYFGQVASQACVLLASLVFYAWFQPANLPYLLASIAANLLLANKIVKSQQPQRKRWLQLALFLNIAFLCTFKYVNFFLRGVSMAFHQNFMLPDLQFPLGISFFTLAQIMYLVDCYEGLLPPLTLFQHATFVSFFPYVISGPIAKAKRMAHQFENFGTATENQWEMLARGCYIFSIGLFKKTVFAYTFAQIADFGFGIRGRLSVLEAWIFAIAYTLQIYFDFSGYSDMAVGSALMLGVQIPRNFDSPLRSKSIIEFWTRWHISFSDFINTYIYTPIIRSFRKRTILANSIALIITMTIAGLWHGPSVTFVVYGILHGIALAINHIWRKKKAPKLPAFVSWLITFAFVVTALAIFRSNGVTHARIILTEMYNPFHLFQHKQLLALHKAVSIKLIALPLLAGLVCAFYGPSSNEMERDLQPRTRVFVAFSLLTVVSWLYMSSTIAQEFLYFKF